MNDLNYASAGRQSRPARPNFLSALVLGTIALGPAPASAQTADNAAAGSATVDETVIMNPFEVTTTQGHGYVTTNATEGLKTNQSMMDIPQGILVVTRDLIDDLGYAQSSDLLHFVGASNGFQGESMRIRGGSVGYAYVDDLPEAEAYEDNIWVDSYEIIKGAAEVLYLNGSISGLVIKTSKKPLPYDQTILTGSVDDNGSFRFTLDSTGPVGTVGGAKIGYRLMAADQGGDFYFYNYRNSRRVVAPEFQVTLNNSQLRVWGYAQQVYSLPNDMDLVTPQGKLYTGAGRREENLVPGDTLYVLTYREQFEFLQKISDNWSMRLQGSSFWETDNGPIVFDSGGDNWAAGTLTYTSRVDQSPSDFWIIMDDFNGHYNLGPIPNLDAFGFSYEDEVSWNLLRATSNFGTQVVPFNNAAAINALVDPPLSQFPYPAAKGQHLNTDLNSIYWQHSVDIVPNYVTLVAALTWENVRTSQVLNISSLPWQATDVTLGQILHRLGAIFKPVKGISLYALSTTNIIPVTSSGALLSNGQLAPSQQGKDNELGMKTNFLGGRLSSDFAWFHMTTTNGVIIGGTLPNGITYYNPIGITTQEGIDGDLSFSIVPGWQVIGAFYAGHDRDQNNNPVSESWDNSWSIYNRYNFSSHGPLKGFSIGGGINRVGGEWISTSGLSGATAYETPYTLNTGDIKLYTGTRVDAFVSYQFGRHWTIKVDGINLLNEAYAVGTQTAYGIDPSPPTTYSFMVTYKF